ncbi:Endonuclease/exonuclease/phosphatase [Trichoderma sp. SZMC 28013]
MVIPRISRILSTFSPYARRWVPTPPGLPTVNQNLTSLCLSTWNIDAFSPRPVARASAIIGRLLTGPSATGDIIFLQEVSREVRDYLLYDDRIRAGFFITDAEDEIAFNAVPFATITLLSKACFTSFTPKSDIIVTSMGVAIASPVARFKFPSQYGRDALCTDVILPRPKSILLTQQRWQHLRLINVHLDSLASTLHYRKEQMRIVGNILCPTDDQKENGQRSLGLVAGDFNAISQDDQELVARNGLVDAWVRLYGNNTAKSGGWTWGYEKRQNNLMPRRLDRVAMTEGLEPIDMYITYPGVIVIPKPGKRRDTEVRWSDHAGLNCSFRIGC